MSNACKLANGGTSKTRQAKKYKNCTGYRFTTGNEQVDCPDSHSDDEMGDELVQVACNQMEYTRLYDTDSDDKDPLYPPKIQKSTRLT